MSDGKQNDATSRSGGNSIWQNERARRWILYASMLAGVFLVGLVPMWMTARTRPSERNTAQAALRISTLQNTLASETIDARRGEYEPARQVASEFYKNLRTEIDSGRDSVFNEAQQNTLRSIFIDTRDDAITPLARSDPASADRLADLYGEYRQAVGGAPPR